MRGFLPYRRPLEQSKLLENVPLIKCEPQFGADYQTPGSYSTVQCVQQQLIPTGNLYPYCGILALVPSTVCPSLRVPDTIFPYPPLPQYVQTFPVISLEQTLGNPAPLSTPQGPLQPQLSSVVPQPAPLVDRSGIQSDPVLLSHMLSSSTPALIPQLVIPESKKLVESIATKKKAEKVFTCPIEGCDLTFQRRFSLVRHCKKHMGYLPFPCPVPGCGKRYAEAHLLKRHSVVHTGAKPFRCRFGCGKSYGDPSNMRRHELVHAGKNTLQCPYVTCECRFTRSNALKDHLTIVHDRDEGSSTWAKAFTKSNTKPTTKEFSRREFSPTILSTSLSSSLSSLSSSSSSSFSSYSSSTFSSSSLSPTSSITSENTISNPISIPRMATES